MNVEKTIEFILDMQAKAEERFAKADERFAKAEARADRADRRMDRLEAVVKGLVRPGMSLRSDVRELQKWRAQAEKFHARTEENLAEISGKLDALIDIVHKSLRRNGGKRA
jgi:chromosome segregation ATPase